MTFLEHLKATHVVHLEGYTLIAYPNSDILVREGVVANLLTSVVTKHPTLTAFAAGVIAKNAFNKSARNVEVMVNKQQMRFYAANSKEASVQAKVVKDLIDTGKYTLNSKTTKNGETVWTVTRKQ